jgi:TM2 domain-containing membrane protein YozV
LCKMSILDFDFLAARNRVAGFILYLLVGWTGLGLAFALVDLLIALPIPKDENGMIEI